jgi:UDP-N-acetylmuramoyl-tripeptide--D-alanyl-D-alanine ligase
MPILAVGNILDIDPKDILERLEESKGPDGRWQDLDFGYNGGVVKLINDTYNASPESMTHAIKSVSEYRSNNILRKIAIIGDMLELGKYTDEYHSRLVQVINDSDIDKVYFCGDILSSYFESINMDKQARTFKSCNLIDIKEYFDIRNGDLFFFKGGNQIGLNKLVQDFINYLHL